MNKEEFVAFLAQRFSMTKKAAEEVINTFTTGVVEAFHKKHEVNLVGFGKFYAIDIKERHGVNPKTREKMKINAYRQPGFKAGQKLKDAANAK